MGLDIIAALGGLVVPPLFDFIKKKFLGKGQDTPEATISTLATTKPEVLPDYVKAITEYLQAQVSFFNRDVSGQISTWVSDLRAVIRPAATILCIVALILDGLKVVDLDPSSRFTFETVTSSWFGSRIFQG